MKKNYLKPEMEAVVELMDQAVMLDSSPIKDDETGGMAPKWRKEEW